MINTLNDCPSDLITALPVYAVLSTDKVPLNPYREFVHYVQTSLYPKYKEKIHHSLSDFYNAYASEDEKLECICNAIDTVCEGHKILLNLETSTHPRIFLSFNVTNGGTPICSCKFYTHKSFNSVGAPSSSDEEEVAAELDFTVSTELDFLDISSEDNVYDFCKSDKNYESLAVICAFIEGLCNFTEFIKVFKTKTLMVKNITMFVDKLVKPWVSDIAVLYTPTSFTIGAICGEDVCKDTYSYEKYLDSVKKFQAEIKERYGDKFKLEKEQAAEQAANGPTSN